MTLLCFFSVVGAGLFVLLCAALALAARSDERREQALNEFLRDARIPQPEPEMDYSTYPPKLVTPASRVELTPFGAKMGFKCKWSPAIKCGCEICAQVASEPRNVVCMSGGLCPSCAIEKSRAA